MKMQKGLASAHKPLKVFQRTVIDKKIRPILDDNLLASSKGIVLWGGAASYKYLVYKYDAKVASKLTMCKDSLGQFNTRRRLVAVPVLGLAQADGCYKKFIPGTFTISGDKYSCQQEKNALESKG